MYAKFWQVSLPGFLVTLLLIACAQFAPSPQSSHPQATQPAPQTATLLVAAAASLQTAMQEVTTLYIQANPNQTINYVITLQMGILVAYRMYRY